MTYKTIIRAVLLFIEASNSILHGVGLFLLYTLYKREKRTKESSQSLYLINLAASEFLWNFLFTIRDIVKLFYYFGYNKTELHKVFWCMSIGNATGVTYINILAMIYLTGDRLLHIALNLKYYRYWNVEKTKILIAVTWVVNILLSVGFAILMYYKFDYMRNEAQISKIMSVYVMTALYSFYLLFALFSYMSMFIRYVKSQRQVRRLAHSNSEENNSILSVFVKSKFFLSVILIASYLVLTVLPCLVRSLWYISFPGTMTYAMTAYYLFSTRLSHTADAFIYTFMQKRVRELLWKKMKCSCFRFNNGKDLDAGEMRLLSMKTRDIYSESKTSENLM